MRTQLASKSRTVHFPIPPVHARFFDLKEKRKLAEIRRSPPKSISFVVIFPCLCCFSSLEEAALGQPLGRDECLELKKEKGKKGAPAQGPFRRN